MYARSRCGLCDEARKAILSIRGEIPFRYEEVLIDGRDDLEREYGLRVPVVLVDGEEAFEVRVDRADLRAALR